MIGNDAKAHLHDHLRWVREALVWKLDGLDEYAVRRPLTSTGTNLLGLVKHVSIWDSRYLGEVFDRPFPEPLPRWDDLARHGTDHWATENESRADIIGLYERVWAHTDGTIDELQLDARGYVPWWEQEVPLFNVMVRCLSDTTRHAGHADILREGFRRGRAGLVSTARTRSRFLVERTLRSHRERGTNSIARRASIATEEVVHTAAARGCSKGRARPDDNATRRPRATHINGHPASPKQRGLPTYPHDCGRAGAPEHALDRPCPAERIVVTTRTEMTTIQVMSATLPLAQVKSKFSEMIDRVEHTHDRIVVTRNGRPAAVMISPDDLASLEDTLELLSDPDAMRELTEAKSAADTGDYITGDELRARFASK